MKRNASFRSFFVLFDKRRYQKAVSQRFSFVDGRAILNGLDAQRLHVVLRLLVAERVSQRCGPLLGLEHWVSASQRRERRQTAK